MTPGVRAVVTVTIFVVVLALVVIRPRRWSEAWWTMLGAAAMLALGLVTPSEALAATLDGKSALLFLLSLLALSLLVGKSGFFEWAAIVCARVARGNARALFRNTFVLGALVTAALSLDTTAVILTPVVLVLVKKLKLLSAPYILLCAFVSNVGSLLLPISNLTNLLFADAFHLTFAAFAARMVLPQLVALAVTYALLRFHARRELPARFDAGALADPGSVIPDRAYFLASSAVLVVVLVGYFVAPLLHLEPYLVAFAGSAVLAVLGVRAGRVHVRDVRELSWGIFPFVIGLFVAVRGLENLGIVEASSSWLEHLRGGSPAKLLAVAAATGAASNLLNNLPTALIARGVLVTSHAHLGAVLAALVGADVGPLVTPFGSLATMLVLALARREGEDLPMRRLVLFGLFATPIIVVATTGALMLVSVF